MFLIIFYSIENTNVIDPLFSSLLLIIFKRSISAGERMMAYQKLKI